MQANKERMAQRRKTVEIVIILLFFLSVLLFLTLYGRAYVSYAAQPVVKEISAPYYAFNAWRENKVHGRVLFLFDRYLSPDPEPPDQSPLPSNYIYLSLEENLINKVYHVVPDSAWPAIEKALEDASLQTRHNDILFTKRDRFFRVIIAEGVPVIIVRLKDIPRIKERVLVNINRSVWNDEQMRAIGSLLATGAVCSDLITISGTNANDDLKEIHPCDDIS